MDPDRSSSYGSVQWKRTLAIMLVISMVAMVAGPMITAGENTSLEPQYAEPVEVVDQAPIVAESIPVGEEAQRPLPDWDAGGQSEVLGQEKSVVILPDFEKEEEGFSGLTFEDRQERNAHIMELREQHEPLLSGSSFSSDGQETSDGQTSTSGTHPVVPQTTGGNPNPQPCAYLDYTMLHSTDPGGPVFAPIAIAGTPIVLADDAVSGLIPMGFTFNFYENAYTDLYVSSNGFITFNNDGDNGCCSGDTLPDAGTPNNLIAFWWEDLDPPEGGTISYDTVGAAPNRIFVLEFDTIQHWPNGDPCTMQTHLFEGTDIIEIHYTSAVSDGGIHTVGIENDPGTVATVYLNAVTDPPAEVGTALQFTPVPPALYAVNMIPDSQSGYGLPTWDVDYSMTVQNTGLNADTYDLSAAGNAWPVSFWSNPVTELVNEDFEGAFPPAGWNSVDYFGWGDPAAAWHRDDYIGWIPNFAGSGHCAETNSDFWSWWMTGTGGVDAGLETPHFSLAGYASATLEFDMSYLDTSWGMDDYAEVWVNDGAWHLIASYDEDHSPFGPGEHVTLDLTPFIGNPDVFVDFYYYDNWIWGGWWQVDNVQIYGDTGAVPVPITSVGPVAPGDITSFTARVNIPGWAGPGDLDTADITATSQGDPTVTDTGQITTQVPYTQLFEDFDTGANQGGYTDVIDPGWPIPTQWEMDDPSLAPPGIGPGMAYSGSNCAGTNIWDWYYLDADVTLVSPYVQAFSGSYLSFYHWYEMDTWGDEGGFVEISADGGPWTQIYPVGGYPWWGWMGGYLTDGYSGLSAGWEYAEFDLSPFAGQVVQARFHFASDGWGFQSGWYVDDISFVPPPPYVVDLTPDSQSDYGFPTQDVDYTFTVENTGSSADTYDLSVAGNAWPVSFYSSPVVLEENFDGAVFPPAGWSTAGLCVASQTGWPELTHYWARYNDVEILPILGTGLSNSPPNAAGLWWSDGNGGDVVQDEWLMTPSMDFSSYTGATLEFESLHMWSGGPDYHNAVEVSTDGGFTWTPVADLINEPQYEGGSGGFAGFGWSWYEVPISIDLTPFCGFPSVIVGWHYYETPPNTGDAVWMIDDIFVNSLDLSVPITSIGPVAPNDKAHFIARVNIPGWAGPGDLDTADITATSQGDPTVTDTGQITTQVPYTQLFEDFDTGANQGGYTEVIDPGWPIPTQWEMDDPSLAPPGIGPGAAYSGSNCAGTNIWDWYYWDADITLVSPYVALGPGAQTLTFQHWYEMDTWGDEGGFVEISADGGPWTQIYPVGGYPWWGYMGGYWIDGYSGISAGWEYATFDLTPFADHVVQARLHFASDGWGWQSGWYVDDIWIGPVPYAVELTPPVQGQTGQTGTYVDYVLTIENTGTQDDTYDLTTGPGNAWDVTFWDITGTTQIFSIFVPAGGSVDFIARVWIPAGESPGSFDTATIIVTSQNDPVSSWDDAVINTNGEPQFWFDADPLVQTRFGWNGDFVDHVITIHNTGTEQDVYMPMWEDGFEWPIWFYDISRLNDIPAPIEPSEWWFGPVDSGDSIQFIARVLISGEEPGDLDRVPITITSTGDDSTFVVDIITRTSLPFIADDFEDAGTSGVFGFWNGVYQVWTRNDPNLIGVNAMTWSSGSYSMYTQGGGVVTSAPVYMDDLPTGIVSYWVQRGDVGFSEDPDDGHDLIVEYCNEQGSWVQIDHYKGFGDPGRTAHPVHELPNDALHPRFQLRFSQLGGAPGADYWHIDDVYIGPPDPNFDLWPDYQVKFALPGAVATHDLFVTNSAFHSDYYQVDCQGDWPTSVRWVEDFNDGNYNGWRVVDEGVTQHPSDWDASSGQLVQDSNIWWNNGQAWSGTYIYTGYMGWTDYTLSTMWMSSDDDGVGVMGRYTDPDNYYRFHWSADWDKDVTKPNIQRRVLDVCVDGEWTVLESDGVPYNVGQWYNVDMVFNGENIQVYIDGSLIFNVQDDSLDHGAIALYSWGNGDPDCTFDDVMVYNAPGPSSSSMIMGPVPPGESVNYQVVVEVPGTASGGDYDMANIVAASIFDPTVIDTARVNTFVPPFWTSWSDSMESGVNGWTATGLWHQVTDGVSPYPNSHSPTTSWWYGQDATGDYETGSTNWGRLVSPPIDLSGVPNAELEFMEWYETEGEFDWMPGSYYDGRWIEISTTGPGGPWMPVAGPPGMEASNPFMWIQRTFDLSPWAGNTVHVSFYFDTLDDLFNNYRGWYVDDVQIMGGVRVHNLDKDTWYLTIQGAVDDADPGNNIFAYSGIYLENVVIDKPLTIMGEDRSTTIVDAQGVGNPFTVRTTGVEISGFTIQNSEFGSGMPFAEFGGVWLDCAGDCNIHDNTFINCEAGVYSMFGHNNMIQDCEFNGNMIGHYSTNYIQDQFNTDTGLWTYSGSAGTPGTTYDFESGYQGWTTGNEPLTSDGYVSIASTWDLYTVAAGTTGFDLGSQTYGTPNNGDMGAENSWIQSPNHVAQGTDVTIEFDSYSSNEGGFPFYWDVEWVEISVNGGAWTAMHGQMAELHTSTDQQWRHIILTYNGVIPGDTVAFRFRYDTGDDGFGPNDIRAWYIDNVAINAHMELTPSAGGLVGRALFMDGMMDAPSRFAVEFDYQIGNLGGMGADGFVFMFYKDTDYAPGGGGSLGFGTTQGYGIEFDHWQNGADPSAEHVALIEDNSDTHLSSADANIDDDAWHHVRVEVDTSTVTVYHDDMVTPLFTWTGTIDRSFGGMGFCGATGGSWAHHWVDNFEIMPLGPAGDTFTNNIVTNGMIGVMTLWGNDNLITDNFFTNNMVEVVFGLEVDMGLGTPSGGNMAYHNDFVFTPATMALALDFTGTNAWDNGYPSGGNYWSDYPGVDMFSGPVTPQTDPGSDGIGDTPYPIQNMGPPLTQDNYPFMDSLTPLSSSPIDTAFNTMTLDEISALWPAFGAAIQDYLDSISETEENPETGVQEDGGDVGIVEGVSNPPSKHNIETVPEPTTETEPEPATTETSEAEQEEIILESEDQTQETESTQAAQDDASVTTQNKDSGSIWGLFLFPIFIIVAVPSVYRYRKRKRF